MASVATGEHVPVAVRGPADGTIGLLVAVVIAGNREIRRYSPASDIKSPIGRTKVIPRAGRWAISRNVGPLVTIKLTGDRNVAVEAELDDSCLPIRGPED